jgi:hypothetical protein
MRRFLPILLLAAVCISAPSAAGDLRTAAQLRDRALADPTAWNLLESLTTTIGPRPVGSPGYARAKNWAVAKLRALGFVNIRVEPFGKPSWRRGAESAEIVKPYPLRLSMIGLSGSVPTPPQGIDAPIVVLKSYAELLAAPRQAFRGRIVLVNQPMTRTEDGSGYGAAVPARYGATEAAKRGAVAYLTRSIATGSSRAPHTGAGTYGANRSGIPEAALGVPDADLLQRLAARGPVRLRLKMASSFDPNSIAWNISGEIRGSVRPDQMIVVGGHLDSWDPGTGAVDDGAGIAITTAAAALIGRMPVHPRRTIRVVMWGSEETGGSSDAYLVAHRGELAKIVLAGESDFGAGRVLSVRLPEGAANAPALKPLAAVLAPLNVFVASEAAEHGGSDIGGLQASGVPVFAVGQDASRYFDYHHSADDTLDVVDRTQLNQNVAVWTALLYLTADGAVDFRAKPAR